MKNFVRLGHTLVLTAAYAVVSGAGCLIGTIFGVAQTDIANGADGPFLLEGVVDLAKKAGDTPAQGAAVYWDNAAKNVTTTAAGNTKIGVATKAAAGADATVRVRLNGSF